MENTLYCELAVIKSKRINRKNPFVIAFLIIFLAAIIISLMPQVIGYEKGTIPLTVKVIATLIYVGNLLFFVYISIRRPVKTGVISFFSEKISIDGNSDKQELAINAIDKIQFDYWGYQSKFLNLYGSHNFIHIEAGNKKHKFELQLKSKEEKLALKKALNRLKDKGINVKIKENSIRPFR